MLIDYVSLYSIIAPALVGALFYHRLDRISKRVAILVFISLILEAWSYTSMQFFSNNLYVFHLYTYVEFAGITWIYLGLSTNKHWKNTLKGLFAGFIVFSLINFFYFEDFSHFNSIQCFIEGILVILFCLGYFMGLINKTNVLHLEKSPFFWLTASYLIYFAGMAFLFLYSRTLIEGNELLYWELHSILNIWLNGFYVAVLWLGRKKLILR